MKNIILLLFALAMISSCVKDSKIEEPSDKWNGYYKYLKCAPVEKKLVDKNNNQIGKVTYGVDNDANFYAKYDCSSSGKQLSKTNMFAGDKKNMPVNEPCNPKEDRFPNSCNHQQGEQEYTYLVPLTQLPHCDEPGFVASSHCKFIDSDGQCKDAWAEGSHEFNDKGCGWYDDHYFDQCNHKYTILYGTGYDAGYLKLYQINMTNNVSEVIWTEYVGNNGGSYDAAAYDEATTNLFFANYETGQLWVNKMNDELGSTLCGTLSGTAASATFYNGSYYYVKQETRTINRVDFNTDQTIASITVLSTIPNSVTVTDIAMNPTGTSLYIIGDVTNGGSSQLIKWDVSTNIYYTMSINVEPGSKIAYGPDDVLYAISETNTGSGGSLAYMVDTSTGVLTPIKDGVIIIDDPFSDLSSGVIM
jgi:hypothetical protein